MSYVIAAPEVQTAVAGNLAGIGSQLSHATASAAGPTTNIAAAAADEVSAAISQLFGSYGRDFQALNAQAATFHAEFVSLLRGGATAYLSTEIANAQQSLLTGLNVTTGTPAAASVLDPLLGGLGPVIGGGGGGGGIQAGLGLLLGPLGLTSTNQFGTFLSGLLGGDPAASMSAAGQTAANAGQPYQELFTKTNANLSAIVGDFAERPFPVLQQAIANQARYANTIGANIALSLQDFPNGLNNNIATGQQGATTFDYQGTFEAFQARQAANSQVTSTALQNAAVSLQERLPQFFNDIGGIGQSIGTGDYHGAVHGIPRAVLRLLLDGVNISNGSTVEVEGPAGDLMPLMSGSGSLQQELVGFMAPGTIHQQIAQNVVGAINTSLGPVALSFIGTPIATLDGLARGATALRDAIQTGNGVAALGAIVDMPAYVLNGFLNGNTVVDLTIPLSASFDFPGLPLLSLLPFNFGVGAPVVLHMPFTGILTPPQPISATIHVPHLLGTVPVTMSFADMTIGGTIPTLLNQLPQSIAAAITPK